MFISCTQNHICSYAFIAQVLDKLFMFHMLLWFNFFPFFFFFSFMLFSFGLYFLFLMIVILCHAFNLTQTNQAKIGLIDFGKIAITNTEHKGCQLPLLPTGQSLLFPPPLFLPFPF